MNGAAPGAAARASTSSPTPTAGSSAGWKRFAPRWIRRFDSYEFSRACEALYHFAWDEFCDWYLELAKVQLGRRAARRRRTAVLAAVLDTLLKLLHPVMPFVTETLWKTLTGGESLVIADWPRAVRVSRWIAVAAQRIADMQKLVTEVRRFRSDQGLGDRQKVPARLVGHRRGRPGHPGRRGRRRWPGSPSPPTASRRRPSVEVRLSRRHRASSSSTPRAPSTSPPSGAGWRRIWPPRRRNWRGTAGQARQRGVPGQGARRRRRQDPGPPAGRRAKRSSGSRPAWPGWHDASRRSSTPNRPRTRSRRCCRSSTCSTSAGRRPRSSRSLTRIAR